MDDKQIRQGIEGLIVLVACVVFASGVGLVAHSVGWFLIALASGYGAVRFAVSRGN